MLKYYSPSMYTAYTLSIVIRAIVGASLAELSVRDPHQYASEENIS